MPRPNPHILVIRLSAMGDVAIAVPLLNTLVCRYPELEFTVLTKNSFAPLFHNIPRVKVKIADVKSTHKGIPGLYKLSNELKESPITAIADIHNVLRSKVLGFFLKSNGLKVFKINKGRAEKKALTRTENKHFKPLKTTANRYADVFEHLGFPLDLKTISFLDKIPLGKEMASSFKWTSNQKWIGIAPFAAHEGKTYPLHLMEQVITKLAKGNTYEVFLFGSPQESSTLDRSALPYKNVHNLAGKFDFKTELKFISNLDLMLSMDSGNGHLAAMYGVKVITIWGQTHPYLGFAPYGQTKDCQLLPDREKFPFLPTSVYGNSKGIDNHAILSSISPDKVVEKINMQLDHKV